MLGSEKEPGIMFLTMEELYKKIEARKEEKQCEVLISYQEVLSIPDHDFQIISVGILRKTKMQFPPKFGEN